MLIESPHNERIKLARSLHSRKGREETGLFLAEGPGVVLEALTRPDAVAWLAWCPPLADEQVRRLVATAHDVGIEVVECSERAFRALSDTCSPQGIAAIMRIPPGDLRRVVTGPERCLALVLHEVRDPGNLGSMIRTAHAFAADAVILTGSCADPYEPKVVRATAGSLFHVPVVEADWPTCTAWLHERQIAMVAAAVDAEAILGDAPLPPRTAIIIGNEAHGLPPRVLQDADLRVRIPMPGRAESLNAASAAAVLLYEAARRR